MTTSVLPTTASTTNDLDDVAAATTRPAPSQVKYVVVSTIVATVLFLVGVGGGVLASGGDPAGAFGVGLFTAFWGGPGFGLMAGFALYNLTVERRGGTH